MKTQIKITVLAFGMIKDIIGQTNLELDIEEGQDVTTLRKILLDRFPSMAKAPYFAIAINEEYASEDQTVPHQATVALIPPVSGG